MASGNYFTTASPSVLAGLMLQSETRVRVGTARLYGSLEVSSDLYTTYEASIGLQAGASFDLGELDSLGLEHVPSFEKPDTANVLQSSVEILSEEETTINMGVRQFDPRLLEVAVGTGVMYTLGNERLITVGGKCNTLRRPVEIAATNIGCNAPTTPGSTIVSIAAIIITVYDANVQNGLPWSDIVAGKLNVLDLEWMAHPVNDRGLGNRLFNIYVF